MSDIREKQEFGKNYILVDYLENDFSSYRTNMITNNDIRGLLACKKGMDNNNPVLMYDVTNKKLLKDSTKITYEEIKDLFHSITSAITLAEKYLLDEKYLLIDPQFIYTDYDSKEYYFLYIPSETIIEKQMFKTGNPFYALADFLIEKIDHKCEKSVDTVYQFYKMSKERNFSIRSFFEIIDKEDRIHPHEQRVVQKDIIEEPKEMLGEEVTNNVTVIKWPGLIILAVMALLSVFSYIYLKNIWLYSSYLLLIACVFGICAIAMAIKNIIILINNKKEDKFTLENNEISVEEYWQNDEETIFFDNNTMVCNEEENSDDVCLEWKEKGINRRFRITQYPIVVGKMTNEVDCLIDDPSVSRMHLKLMKKEGKLSVIDLNSTNGTSINGKRLNPGEEVPISLYSEIMLGQVILRVV